MSIEVANESGVAKVSIRDIAPVLAARTLGGTTVAATVEIAAAAGIQVLATGGIGGVHRGAERSFDESADLEAIARHPVVVVSAGAKFVRTNEPAEGRWADTPAPSAARRFTAEHAVSC